MSEDQTLILHELDYQQLARYIIRREGSLRAEVKKTHIVSHVDSIGIIASSVPIDIPILKDAVAVAYAEAGCTYMVDRYRPLLMENSGLVRIVTKLPGVTHDSFRTFLLNADIQRGLSPFQWYIFTGKFLLDILNVQTDNGGFGRLSKRSGVGVAYPDILINTGLFIDDRLAITTTRAYSDIIHLKTQDLIYSKSLHFEPEVYYQHLLASSTMTPANSETPTGLSPVLPVLQSMHWLNHVYIDTADYRDSTAPNCKQCNIRIYGKYYRAYNNNICKFCAHRSGINSSDTARIMVRKSPLTLDGAVSDIIADPELAAALSATDYQPVSAHCYANARFLLYHGTVVGYINESAGINGDPNSKKRVIIIKAVVS